MSELGLYIAKAGESVHDNELDFDSRNKHLLVDLNAKPKHFDVLDITGTALASAGTGSGSIARETLFQIAHGLPYVPKIEIYFFDSGNWNLYAGSGSYFRGTYYYEAHYGPGTFDIIYGQADATYFYIKHDYFSSAGPSNSVAPTYPLKVKYYIFSNKGTSFVPFY